MSAKHGPHSKERLQYPFEKAPEPGSKVEICPGVFWLRLPLPFALDHINVWLLDDGDAWTLVDTGCSTRETVAIWDSAAQDLLDNKPISRVIVTHHHPDHIGMAGALRERYDCEVFVNDIELSLAARLCDGTAETEVDRDKQYYRSLGLEPDEAFLDFCKGAGFEKLVGSLPSTSNTINDGVNFSIGDHRWDAMLVSGHAPGHICLFDASRKLLISGDQLLPTITTNISVFAQQPDENPLEQFLDSMQRFAQLPDDTTVLPSHGKVFIDPGKRARQLIAHHDQTLERTSTLCADTMTANEVCASLFPYIRAPLDLMLGMGEAVAHLNYLIEEGSLKRELIDGVWRYSAPS